MFMFFLSLRCDIFEIFILKVGYEWSGKIVERFNLLVMFILGCFWRFVIFVFFWRGEEECWIYGVVIR